MTGPVTGPLVSAVVPAYNVERFLSDAIDSVLAQTYSPVECIVVDDGSSDRTAAIAGEYGDHVRLLRQTNRGVSAARNHGAKAARGEVLAFLDGDDVWMAERLAEQVPQLFEGSATAALCAAQMVDEALRPIDVLHTDPIPTPKTLLMQTGSLSGVSSSLILRADYYTAVGGFDELLSTSADWDLLMRLVRRGQIAYTDRPLFMYRVHGHGLSRNISTMERDMRIAYRKTFRMSPDLRSIKRPAYARLHWMLGGSYWNARSRAHGLVHLCAALVRQPRLAARLLPRVKGRLTTPSSPV